MIYIIISNVGLALMMIVVYFRYSRYRKTSGDEMKQLRQKIEVKMDEIRGLEERLFTASRDDKQKIETLLREIDELRRDKERELKIRMEAEKQIDLALQKTSEIEKRVQDWRVIQDAVMKDSKDAIMKVGNDLYKKLSDNYKIEVETNKNLIGKVSKNITALFDKFASEKKGGISEGKTSFSGESPASDAVLKKLVADLVTTMKASGHLANKDYFLPANFDEQRAKALLCEVAFVSSGKLYLIDFKSCRYLEEYKARSTNKEVAEVVLKQKLDKYIAYLNNLKYRESIMKVMSSTKAKFSKSSIIFAVGSNEDLQILKEIRYYEKVRRFELEVMDFDGVSDIVI
jgi:hypothetical protein